jgi:voltage-gated potassium channel
MAKLKAKRILGLAGVAVTETAVTQRIGAWLEWFMLCIAFWLPIQWYLQLQNTFSIQELIALDWFVWGAFLSETLLLTVLVRRKFYYLRGNWLNLVIIIVACPIFYNHFTGFGVLRLIRLLILFRIILPWLRNAHNMLTLNRIGMTLLVFFIGTSLSGVLVSTLNTGIKNPFEGIWWAWETVTTVGYGDVVPTTITGKLIAMVVMLLGIVLFSIVTATVSAYFVGKDKKTELYTVIRKNKERLESIESIMKEIRNPLDLSSAELADKFVRPLTPEQRQALLAALQRARQQPAAAKAATDKKKISSKDDKPQDSGDKPAPPAPKKKLF